MPHRTFGLILSIAVVSFSSALSQQTYVPNENAFSASLFIGRYNAEYKWGFQGSYALLGIVQVSYTRSSVLSDPHVKNFQEEYFLRVYGPRAKRFFISLGIGYLYQKVGPELLLGFPVVVKTHGVGFEGGLHYVAENSETRRTVVSVSYLHFKPREELLVPGRSFMSDKFARSVSVDVAVVYYLGQVGLVVGPRITLDTDFRNVFFGVQSSFLIRH